MSVQVEEKRYSDDGKAYTLKEFIGFCGEEDGKWYWDQAPPEKRISDDGKAYTLKEFIGFCGEEDGKWYFSQAKPAPAQGSTTQKSLAAPASGTARARSNSPAPPASSGNLEQDVTKWIEAVTWETKGSQPVMDWLKDGQVLCRMANLIKPGICPRINTQAMPFKQMENVTAFIQAARQLGVMEKDVFSTVDLYEAKNKQSVLNCIYSLGGAIQRTVPEFEGPFLGVAQNNAVKDSARAKTTVTQDSGFRKDLTDEVRAGVSRGRHM